MDEIILTEEEQREFKEEILKALNENYVLKSKGETDQDCIVHDIIASIWQKLPYLTFIENERRKIAIGIIDTLEHGSTVTNFRDKGYVRIVNLDKWNTVIDTLKRGQLPDWEKIKEIPKSE